MPCGILVPLALALVTAWQAPAAQNRDSVAPWGHAAAPQVRAARLEGAIVIDGRLDEAAWTRAEPATRFTQTDPS
jgi:hypothetical protein